MQVGHDDARAIASSIEAAFQKLLKEIDRVYRDKERVEKKVQELTLQNTRLRDRIEGLKTRS